MRCDFRSVLDSVLAPEHVEADEVIKRGVTKVVISAAKHFR